MDELEISGRRYISTRRAGKDHKYHADYIGQLIRAKKVEGKKVGRAWYVDADSLAAYLGKEAPAHAPIVMVEDSPSVDAPEEVAMPIVVEKEEEAEPEKKEEPKVVEEKIDAPLIYKTTREAREAQGGLRYIADEGPLLPHIKKTTAEESIITIRHGEPQPIPVKLESLRPHPLIPFAKPLPIKQRKSVPHLFARAAAVVVLGVIVFGVAGLLSTHLLFTLTVDGGQSASVGYGIK